MVREQAFPVETANSVPALVEFFLDHNLGKARSDYVKAECAYHLWRHATHGKSNRSEIIKLGALHKLVETADKGDKHACYHALGCLTQFVDSEDFKTMILAYTGAKLIRCLGESLNNVNHTRTQLQASHILWSIANNAETTVRVVPIVNKLVEALHISGPSWGISKAIVICTQVCQALTRVATLAAGSEAQSTLTTGGYSGGRKNSVRKEMITLGVVGNCVEVMKFSGAPASSAPPPTDSTQPAAVTNPVEEVKVAALATIYALLDEPTCIVELRKIPGALACLSKALALNSVDAKAHAAGAMLQFSENREHAMEIGRSKGAIKELVSMLSTQQEKKSKKKKKKSKKGGGEDAPATGAALCLENAAGLLFQLTACEENTEGMVKEGAIPVLVGLLKSKGSKSLAVIQHSTCILAAIGLNEKYHEMLKEAGAPPYLLKALEEKEE
ncbi:hypothetical protein HOP50_08g51500 [Chloropicon primus]|uniref:Uncharacterized protein n=1 Tax=Chloropicon primus TaxID=1764295 RepID=A0A5B8MSK7_9CHLO|nr:hypothetical protein A3770_08p51230 [Chloropicon primus]UPR01827.1 hypothetical protein HOP50_08g51500 [Chloropicon primus]|eukprot:QDZ22605.1 hypothetical protein A3770_08p51230 [Chloropicon primus]